MAVDTVHAEYTDLATVWEACRAVAKGQRAVHDLGEKFLPKLTNQTTEDYDKYKARALFYNATRRTIAALVGLLFRKDPTVTVPAGAEALLDDINQGGMPFDQFMIECGREYMTVGRFGILIDYPSASPDLTLADALRLNLRPTMTLYRAETIINWQTTRVANTHVLSQVRLKERHVERVDEFTEKAEDRWRVLDLDPAGHYRVRIYRKNERGEEEQVGDDVYPMMNNARLTRIPFEIFPRIKCDDPPLLDLVEVNLSHYRVTADYEHGTHFVGLPTPYITGYVPEPNTKLHIGGTAAWCFPDVSTQVGFLEFHGAGLSNCERNLDRKEQYMAVLGARMLEAPKRDAEAAETASIYRSGENASLGSVADQLGLCFTRALTTLCAWAGLAGEVEVVLNKDFVPVRMDSATLTALVAAWQSGALSSQELFRNLQEGEVIAADANYEDEEARKAENPPPMLEAELRVAASAAASGAAKGAAAAAQGGANG